MTRKNVVTIYICTMKRFLNSDKSQTFMLFLSQNRHHDNHRGNHAETKRGDKRVDEDLCSPCRSAAPANHVTPHLSCRY